jgi:hypothetical protein
MKAILLALVFTCVSAYGQDPGAWAAQQAQQQAIQANQQAIQSMQQASQQDMQNAMQTSANAAQNTGPIVAYTLPPTFSVNAGKVKPGTTVRIKTRSHYAVIYYTTNGWTPTTDSRRYTGPIPIRATTQLQAIAVAPNMMRSPITSATYTVQGAQPAILPLTLSSDEVLHTGTRLHLVTLSTVSSKSAQVGDPLSLMLDQDVKAGDTVLVPKGSPVEAIITQADPASHAGIPGNISFEVHSLSASGKLIPLSGGETLEGANRYKMRGFLLVPVVGLASLAVKGEEAQIKPGMRLSVVVAADTSLQP